MPSLRPRSRPCPRGIGRGDGEAANLRLACALGTDKTGWAHPTAAHPGTGNHKYPDTVEFVARGPRTQRRDR